MHEIPSGPVVVQSAAKNFPKPIKVSRSLVAIEVVSHFRYNSIKESVTAAVPIKYYIFLSHLETWRV